MPTWTAVLTLLALAACETGAHDDAARRNGGANDGSANDGSANDGGASDGSANGGASDGSTNGAANDGSASDGSASDGGPRDRGSDGGVPSLTLPMIAPLPPSLGPRFADGIEPGDPSVCEAAPPARCYWVDADAPPGGDGSFASPASSFEAIVGAMAGADYRQGAIASGDVLYVRGTFAPPAVDDPDHFLRVVFRRASQGGTPEQPTVIKSWRGSPAAVFDGRHAVNDLLVFANMRSFRVANLEIANANGRGLVVESGAGTATFEDLVVHDTVGDGVIGVGGGLHFWGGAGHELVVRHCHFYANNHAAFGAIDNIGALSLTSDLEGPEFGALRVYRNVFERETTGVRHKHAGNYDTEIYENLFWNSERAILLRSFRSNEIRNNVFLDLSASAIVSYVENTRGELRASIHHNDFFDTTRLVTDVIGVHAHDHRLDLHHNFVHSASSETLYEVSSSQSLPFLTGSDNLYVMASGESFFRATDGRGLDFVAFAARIADPSSILRMPSDPGSDLSAHNAVYAEFASERGAGGIGY